MPPPARQAQLQGFTLIELLVALLIMALLAGMGWQVVNTLYLTDQQVRQHSQPLQRWQTVLAQWKIDLDHWQAPGLARQPAIDFNGLVLRWVRRINDPTQPGQEALAVVAWALLHPTAPANGNARTPGTGPQWMRWQSPALFSAAALQSAWADAEGWARSQAQIIPPDSQQQMLVPVQSWQLYFYRQGSWVNPQSTQTVDMPNGVRLQITPAGNTAAEAWPSITVDWVNPHVGGGKSQ